MSTSKPSLPRRILSGLWRGITRVRLAMSNLLFLAAIAFIYFVYVGGAPEPLPAKAALLLNMSGTVVDQRSEVNPLEALISTPSPTSHEILLRDIIEAIHYAEKDPAITSLVMELDELVYVGISKTQEIAQALDSFRKSGKPIVAVADYYTQDQFLLASQADTIIAHPMGGIALEGYSSYNNYFHEALEKVSINVHIFRAGDHKAAVEPFIRDDMSPGEKEVTSRWLNNLWGQYTSSVESRRKLEPGSVNDYVNNFSERLAKQGGDPAQAALQAGLLDKLLGRSETNEYLAGLVGARNDDGLYEAVAFERYVGHKRPLTLPGSDAERVAVITAEGNILPGEQPPGMIGGDSLAQLIRSTVDADGVKAIVLRVNSGGGSMFASEIIRQQLLYAREKKIPVVISMGTVAASGGYYIAADADEIWATPSTITGSIGVFAAFPTFEDLMQRAGIHTDGVGTTELAGSLRVDRELNPELVSALNSGVEFAYKTFVKIVADGRKMTPAAVDPIAQGRVWCAEDALQSGLIDKVGTLADAVAAAGKLANVENFQVEYVEPVLSPRDMLLKQLTDSVGSLHLWTASTTGAALSQLLAPMRAAAREISLLQDPGHMYMRCIACGLVR